MDIDKWIKKAKKIAGLWEEGFERVAKEEAKALLAELEDYIDLCTI